MRSYVALFLVICVINAPTEAFFTDKLALLRSLTGGLGGDNVGVGQRYATNNGENYVYNVPSRSLYSGSGSYGGGYNYGRTASYSSGNQGGDQVVRIIKVVVPAQDTSYVNSGYGTSYTGSTYSAGWTPVQPQPAVAQSDSAPVYQSTPVQVTTVPVSQPAPVHIAEPDTVQISQPAAVDGRNYHPVPVQSQTVVKTLKLIVTEDDGNQNYIAPAANSYSSGYGVRQNSNNWNPAYISFPNLWNKSWKSRAGWETLGC